MSDCTGIVIIGQNEGDALLRTLRALRDAPGPMVYVDSASTDGSVAAARSCGIDVITLDSRAPLSAARGRNAGFAYLAERHAELRYVQFVDGDCMVDPTWLSRGREELETKPNIAALAGQVRELDDTHLYSRLLDMEWHRPAGDATHCGGIFMVRVDAFARVDMFDETLSAGEEPDLCQRLRAAGYRTVRIDAPMALHDGRLTRWAQWSSRQQRGGRGSLCVCLRSLRRGEQLYLRQVISTWMWTVGWTAITATCFCFDWRVGVGAVVLAPLQAVRIAAQGLRRGLRITDALAFGTLTMIGKWQQLQGQCRWAFAAMFAPCAAAGPMPLGFRCDVCSMCSHTKNNTATNLMKIAYLNSCYPAMSHTFIQREIEAVRACGIEVETFSCRKPDAVGTLGDTHAREASQTIYLQNDRVGLVAEQFTANPLRYARLLASARSLRQVAYLIQAARLARQMRRRGISHVHVHMANNGADVARLATQLDPTLSYSLMIHGPSDFFDVHALDLPRKVAQARFVCCISHFCRSQVMIFTPTEHWPKLHIVHCGIDPRKFPRKSPRKASTAQNTPNEPLRMLTVGRLAPVKGQLQLLEACNGLNIDWQLNIVGDGPLRAQLEAAADPKRVTFSGAVSPEDMAAHYDNADLFVLSSFAEGVPVVLMEAMAKGLPVIATQVGGVSELIDDGVTGRLVAPGNVAMLTKAIEEAAAGDAPWVSASDVQRAKIVEAFNITTIGAQLTSLFERYSVKPQAALDAVALQA